MTEWLGMSASPRRPRPELRERVLTRALAPRRARWPVAAAASLVIAGALSWGLSERAALTARVAALEDTLGALRGAGMRTAHIAVTVAGRPGTITIIADSATRRWLVSCHNLAPNAAGEAYQLWFMTTRGYISAHVMPMDSPAPMTVVLELPADTARVLGAAMTIEPRRGSRAATGPIVFERML